MEIELLPQSIITKCQRLADEYNLWFTQDMSEEHNQLSIRFSAKTGNGLHSHFNIFINFDYNRCYCSSLYKWFDLNVLDNYIETLCDLIAE